MPVMFRDICRFYNKIERTSKRLEMIALLARMFQYIKKREGYDDLDKVVYLTRGKLYLDWKDAPKLGIAEKTVIQALTIPSGLSGQRITTLLRKTGDLGITAYHILRPDSKIKGPRQKSLTKFLQGPKAARPSSFTVAEFYEALEDIAQKEGHGSQDQKIASLAGLISKCSPVEAKFLVRILTSTLRLGVAEMTILDALAVAYAGSKDLRPAIERAYNIHPDMGRVAQILYEHGLDGLEALQIEVGVPIKMMLASRLHVNEILPKLGGECMSEYKLDGERLQVHKRGDEVTLFSRRLIKITDQYPDVVAAVRARVHATNTIFEGEVVAMDQFYEKMRPFQVVSRRRRKFDVHKMQEEVPVTLFAFDLLYLDGVAVMDQPYLERRAALRELFEDADQIKLVTARRVTSEEELVAFFKHARDAGTEGTVNKSLQSDSIYKAGNRGFLWVKLKSLELGKMADTIDVTIVGAYWGTGRRQGVYGAFLLAAYNNELEKYESFTKIGSGFSDEQLQEFRERLDPLVVPSKPKTVICSEETPDVWVVPSVVVEVTADEITTSSKFDVGRTIMGTSGYSLRFPVFQRLREEKAPEESTSTAEIHELYRLQLA